MATVAFIDRSERDCELGQLRAEYRVSSGRLAIKALWTAALVAVLLAGPVTWMYRGSVPPLPKDLSGAFWAILGVLIFFGFVAWSVWSLVRALADRHQRVLVFDQGFVSLRRGQTFICRWEDVRWTKEEVFQVFLGYYPHLTIGLRSGQQWVMNLASDLLRGFAQLEETIAREVARHQLSGALADLRAGKTLDFGKLKLSSAGITMGEQSLGWCDVGEFHREDMGLTIVKRGAFLPWAQIHTNELVNQGLLRELVRELCPKS